MAQRSKRLFRLASLLALGAIATGCLPHQNMVTDGNADMVTIRFFGDVRQTVPLARQHCAQYERDARQRDISDEFVTYACVRR